LGLRAVQTYTTEQQGSEAGETFHFLSICNVVYDCLSATRPAASAEAARQVKKRNAQVRYMAKKLNEINDLSL
jgi:hypothetical protein